MIKQAVILSAGLGTRLRPATENMPKVMIPILGKPLLLWHIEQFKKHGVSEFFINLHYLPEVIQNYFGDGSKWGVKINYSFEPIILGTAGGVKRFEDKLDDEFFLIYGDTFSLANYSRMETNWRTKPEDALGMQRTQKSEDYADADVAELDSSMLFLKIHPKPHTRKYASAHRLRGIFILRKKLLSHIPSETHYEIGKELLPDIVSRGEKFHGYESNDYSKGIDTLEKWREVEDYLRRIS